MGGKNMGKKKNKDIVFLVQLREEFQFLLQCVQSLSFQLLQLSVLLIPEM